MTPPLSPLATGRGHRNGGGRGAGLPGVPPPTAHSRSVAGDRGVSSGDDEAARVGSAVSQQPVSNPDPGGPPPVAWLRADQATWGDRMLRDGNLVAVLGVHAFDTPFGPVIRLQLADGSDWRGAPCDRIAMAVQR